MIRLLLILLLTCSIYAEEKPNIILILVDDMGYSDISCFGSEIKTPNIDAMAKKGMIFTNFTNCAKCETTRTSLLSGRFYTGRGGAKFAQSSIIIPENLKLAGYQTFMVGKCHVFNTPHTRGFDKSFGFINGAVNFYTGESTRRGQWQWELNGKKFDVPKKYFYCTTEFTKYAIKFIGERDKTKPFFMYTAYNAPHYPLQAPKKEVMKYRGKYKDGWTALKKKRLAGLKATGIVPSDQKLAKEDDLQGAFRKWDSLSAKEKDTQDLLMATYAAMIDMVDQDIGKIIAKLKEEKIYENTIILFLSDNGACPFDRTYKETREKHLMPWDPKSFWCYTTEWANACNTPFRKYKQSQNEGGISTPLIVHWPKGIKNPGRLDRQRGHLVDLHATFRDLAGAQYPAEFKGNKLGKPHGLSLVPAFKNEKRQIHSELFYAFSNKYSALLHGDWKMVDKKFLYNIKDDRIEMNDLKSQHPDKFKEMVDRWTELHKIYSLGDGKSGKDKKKKNKKKKNKK